jgi:hypothetical protein
MTATWDHPQLGRFACRFDERVGEIEAPGFDVFTWHRDDDEPAGRYEMCFFVDGPGETPSDAAVAVALRVRANHEALAREVARALWNEFDGRGPGSSIWARYPRELLARVYRESRLPEPAGPDDLRRGMKLVQIAIRTQVDGYPRPVADLLFAAVFAEEHGLSVLTDGAAVLGSGFHLDVKPYTPE